MSVSRLRGTLLPPLLAIAFSALLCGAAVLISGSNPVEAAAAMISEVGRGHAATDIVNGATTYYFVSLAAAVGFQMNLLNIGVEGQYRIAACCAAIVGGAVDLPLLLHIPLILFAAVVVGSAWAGVAALLKVTRGVNEVISTIMLNAIATGIIALLLRPSVAGELRGNTLSTSPIPPSGLIPGIDLGGRGEIFGMVFVAAALGVGYGVLLNRTRFGFELKASGESPTAAAAGGVNAKRMILFAMLLSGGLAAFAGLPELLGRDAAYFVNAPQGYGFAGLAIALLGRNHPVGVAFGCLLWAFLDRSALALDNAGVPREIVTIMQGSIVLSVVVAYAVVRRFELAATQRRVSRQLAEQPVPVAGGGS